MKTMQTTRIKFLMIFLTWSQVHGQEGSGSEEFLPDYTIEDNFVIEGSGENYEQSGDDFCSEGSGSGEEEVLSVLQSASYSMSASDLIIDISLQRMSDDSVTMVCNVAETEGEDVEGSGAARASASNFPAKLFLIRDVAVCADLSSAVGNDISTSAIELATVPGPVTDTAPISVTWDEVRQSNCVAMLKTSPVTEEEAGSGEEEVIIEFRTLTPRDCRRRRSGLILPNRLAGTRTFAVLNLAGFSLVAVGVTGAFAVAAAAAAAPSVSGSVPSFTDSYTLSNSLLTVAPFALVFLVYHYMGLPLSRRRNDLLRRQGSNPRIKSLSERIENVREDMTSIIRVLEPVRHFGEAYMEKLSQGPVGSLFRAGSYLMRRWDSSPRHENRRKYEYNDYNYSY